MSLSTVEMLNHFIDFSERAIQANTGSGQSARFTRELLRSFVGQLSAFNDDSANQDTLPFFFIHREQDEIGCICEADIDVMLLAADTAGLSAEFFKERTANGDVVLYFSHAARDYAAKLCNDYGYGYASLGGNGLSIKGLCCAGLFTASVPRLRVALLEAKVLLAQSR
jgi:hypothetical protein